MTQTHPTHRRFDQSVEASDEIVSWFTPLDHDKRILVARNCALRAIPIVAIKGADEAVHEAEFALLAALRVVFTTCVLLQRESPSLREATKIAERVSAIRARSYYDAASDAGGVFKAYGLYSTSYFARAVISTASITRAAEAAAASVAMYSLSAFRVPDAVDPAVISQRAHEICREDALAEEINYSDPVRISADLENLVNALEAQSSTLLVDDNTWSFWFRWLHMAIRGDAPDLRFQTSIALIPNAIWEAGPETVADAIARIQMDYEDSTAPRPDSVPEIEKRTVLELAQALLSVPNLTSDFAMSSAETVERATREFLNTSGENCLPPELQVLDHLPNHFRRIASIVRQRDAEKLAAAALEAEIEQLNEKVARLEAGLKVARSKSLDGRFKAAAIENLAKTVTSPWMIGALGFGVCHFFGWTPSEWTLANLRGYAEELQKAVPKAEPP